MPNVVTTTIHQSGSDRAGEKQVRGTNRCVKSSTKSCSLKDLVAFGTMVGVLERIRLERIR